MKRREFIAATAALLVSPRRSLAQGKPRRIGVFGFLDPIIAREAWRSGLREKGWIEGKNLLVEYRYAETPDRVPTLVAELIALSPDLLIATNPQTALALRDGTSAVGEKADTAFQRASVGQPTEPCLVVVGRLRIILLHDLPFQVVVDGVAARQLHAVWSRLDPSRGQLPPADVTACAGRRRIVADGLHGQSSSTTSIAPSFHGRREGTGELEPIAQIIVSCHPDI
jgi:hypothetical protein